MSRKTRANILSYLKPRLSRRSVVFVLCLLLSALFWLLTSLSKTYVDELIIPVKYINVPEEMLVENEPTESVKAEVKGFGFDLLWHWLKFEKAEIVVNANPSSLASFKKAGEDVHFLLTETKTGKLGTLEDDQLEILKIYPDTLFLKFQPIYTKTVPVMLDASYSFEKQFDLSGPILIEPDSIQISGIQSLIEPLSFVTTEPVEWIDLSESISETVPIISSENARLIRYNKDQVQVTLSVQEFTEGSVSVPLTIQGAEHVDVNLFPSSVEVKYLVALEDFDRITADMFAVQVSLDEESQDKHFLMAKIIEKPSNVKYVRAIPSQVEFIVRK